MISTIPRGNYTVPKENIPEKPKHQDQENTNNLGNRSSLLTNTGWEGSQKKGRKLESSYNIAVPSLCNWLTNAAGPGMGVRTTATFDVEGGGPENIHSGHVKKLQIDWR